MAYTPETEAVAAQLDRAVEQLRAAVQRLAIAPGVLPGESRVLMCYEDSLDEVYERLVAQLDAAREQHGREEHRRL